jgi:hypothetical protein
MNIKKLHDIVNVSVLDAVIETLKYSYESQLVVFDHNFFQPKYTAYRHSTVECILCTMQKRNKNE